MIRRSIAVAIAIATMAVAAVLTTHGTAQAVSGGCHFTSNLPTWMGEGTCSVVDLGNYTENDVFTGRTSSGGGEAMPSSQVSSKETFISYVKDRWHNGNRQDKVGAAFIVQRMRGSRAWPTNADVTDWETRMRNPALTYAASTQTVTSSSWYDSSKYSNFFASRPAADRTVVRIMNGSSVMIEIQRSCGNPTMRTDEYMPPYNPEEWRISGSTSVNRTTARPGEQIQWTHTVRNNGPTSTGSTSVRSWSNVRGFRQDSWNGEKHVIEGAMANGATRTHTGNATYTPTQEDVGRTLCQRVHWRPTAHTGSGGSLAEERCVTIIAAPWSTSATSSVNQTTAAPGDVIRWTHTLTLNSNPNHWPINSRTYSHGFREGSRNGDSNQATTPAWQSVGLLRTIRSEYTVRQDDVGRTMCQQLRWGPTSSASQTGTGSSSQACVYIPYDYNLVPSISTNPGGALEPGTDVTVRPHVNNDGNTRSRDTEWVVSELVVRKNTPLPHGGEARESSAAPIVHYRPNNSYEEVARSTGAGRVFERGMAALTGAWQTRRVGDLNVGDKLCWGLSVRPYNHSTNNWRHSALECITVGKTPKVQFWGADVKSSAQMLTRSTTVDTRMYGSWAEYAIMSTGTVSSASGAALSSDQGAGRVGMNASSLNPLTFANTGGVHGNFGALPPSTIPEELRNANGTNISGTIDLSSLNSGSYVATGNISLSGNISAGRSVIIKATGRTVTITGNITYDNSRFTNFGQVPQLVINARDIIIAEGVEEVNAWLLASGYVSTCGAVTAPASWLQGVTSETCNNPLRVNGPVMTDRLYLRRTSGSTTESPYHRGSPAEVFNLRPDSYMWAASSAGGSSLIRTTYVRELPPRL